MLQVTLQYLKESICNLHISRMKGNMADKKTYTERNPHLCTSSPSSTPRRVWQWLVLHSRTLESYFRAAQGRLLGIRAGPAKSISSPWQVYQLKRLQAEFLLLHKKGRCTGFGSRLDFRSSSKQDTSTLEGTACQPFNFLAVAGVSQVLGASISDDC